MNHKNILNETNFMRRMMGLQAINERLAISPEEQENMQLISNVMTPEGFSKPLDQGGYGTVPFKDSEEGREWKTTGGSSLSLNRLESATNKTIEDANVGSWKAKKTGSGVEITDLERDFLTVIAPKGCNPNWCYIVKAGENFPEEHLEEDFGRDAVTSYKDVQKNKHRMNMYGRYSKKFPNYEAYAIFLEEILHKHSPIGSPSDPEIEPELDESWCKRFLDIDWYFDKLKIGKGYLKKYDCGEAVEVAQDHMNEYEGSEVLEVDSAYGDKTIKEVKVVQDELDLKADGYYGQKTHDALIRAIGAGKGAPDQPEDELEKMPIKGHEEIDVDVDVEKEVVAPDVEIDTIESEFEKKAKAKALKRKNRKQKRGQRKLDRLGRKKTRYKKRYDLTEQKTFKVKKDGKVITLTESDVRKIVNLKK